MVLHFPSFIKAKLKTTKTKFDKKFRCQDRKCQRVQESKVSILNLWNQIKIDQKLKKYQN